MGKDAWLTRARNYAPGAQRDGILVDRFVGVSLDTCGLQSQRAAERAAQVVSLGQLSGVNCQQCPRAGQESEIERGGIGHAVNLYAGALGATLRAAAWRGATETASTTGSRRLALCVRLRVIHVFPLDGRVFVCDSPRGASAANCCPESF
jgi:hypothetical protein